MAEHTPGPWIHDEPSNWLGLSARVCTENYEPIAQVQMSGWPKRVARANTQLIAAAPDLLAAYKKALVWISGSLETVDEKRKPSLIEKTLAAAIAKAEKQST